MTAINPLLRKILPATGLVVFLGAPIHAAAGGAEDVEQVLAAAESSLGEARKARNSWTSTEQLMTAARQALVGGELEEAAELARRALLTADMAQTQTQQEQDAWSARVPAR